MGMELRVLGSSSSGNCYILDNGNEALIIEAGIRFIDVKKALDFNIRKVVGCLITHQHNDHAKYAKAMVDCGFHVLALPEVIESKELKGSRVKAIKVGSGYLLGGFRVIPFPAFHDVPCVGYFIKHPYVITLSAEISGLAVDDVLVEVVESSTNAAVIGEPNSLTIEEVTVKEFETAIDVTEDTMQYAVMERRVLPIPDSMKDSTKRYLKANSHIRLSQTY